MSETPPEEPPPVPPADNPDLPFQGATATGKVKTAVRRFTP